jgi:diaminopimelate decarboxylase
MKLDYNILNELAITLGDSFYILDIEKFRENYKNFKEAFYQFYPKTEIAYSYKTNYIPLICKTVNSEGGYAEVVSGMEYDLAMKIGVDPKKVIVNGPYKPFADLERFLLNGSILNLDSYTEANSLKEIVSRYPEKEFNIGFRCNFDIGTGTKSRFGFDTESKEFYKLVEELTGYNNINFVNLHCHFPNRDLKYFESRVANMIKIYRKIYKNGQPQMIDIGGGLGGNISDFVRKQLPYDVADYSDYANIIAKMFYREFERDEIKPTLVLEPGTAIVADTLTFICRVVDIKEIRGSFIVTTSGSKVNFNPMASTVNLPMNLYGQNKPNQKFYKSIDISGYTCMEGDYLHKGYKGSIEIGDFVEVENVGSYSIVNKPPFILPNVPIITSYDGQIKVLKRAEGYEDIFQTYNFE